MSKNKGKRYSVAEREKILAHVEEVNRTRGRGGISSAAKKFGVTPLTISNWLKQTGSNFVSSLNPNAPNTFRRMAGIHEEMAKKERELDKLRAEYLKLKKSL